VTDLILLYPPSIFRFRERPFFLGPVDSNIPYWRCSTAVAACTTVPPAAARPRFSALSAAALHGSIASQRPCREKLPPSPC